MQIVQDFWNVLHRFKTDSSYATVMTQTGRNEEDIAEIDPMAVLHLRHRSRTASQRTQQAHFHHSLPSARNPLLASIQFSREDGIYYPWMTFWHGEMLHVRQFVIGVKLAGLTEVRVVTFNSGWDCDLSSRLFS